MEEKKSLLSKELKAEISRFARDDDQWRRWTNPPPTPPKKNKLRRCLTPFDMTG